VAHAEPHRVVIREASLGDAARIAELSGQLSYPTKQADVERRMRALPQDGSHAVFIAEDGGGRVVGWAHVYALHFVGSELRAEVAGLVVDESCRRGGVGIALMARVEEWAREKSLPAVTLRSNVIREPAHKFYEKLGYTRIKTQHAFRKVL
jgi:N-acetylglutamate synthase-like GNAT family acetyltransferase